MRRLRFAVVPTRDRPNDFADCVAALQPQVDRVVVVSHGAPYADPFSLDIPRCSIVAYAEDPPNISRMWNLGLDQVHWLSADEPYDVAVLNDDVVIPEGWFDKVTQRMRTKHASMGSPPRPGRPELVSGFAFILDGSMGLRADEQFQWWGGEDDLQRRAGTVALVPGAEVEHRRPNSTTVGVLAQIAGDDRDRFIQKWGVAAW
jgi:hypothetical protein